MGDFSIKGGTLGVASESTTNLLDLTKLGTTAFEPMANPITVKVNDHTNGTVGSTTVEASETCPIPGNEQGPTTAVPETLPPASKHPSNGSLEKGGPEPSLTPPSVAPLVALMSSPPAGNDKVNPLNASCAQEGGDTKETEARPAPKAPLAALSLGLAGETAIAGVRQSPGASSQDVVKAGLDLAGSLGLVNGLYSGVKSLEEKTDSKKDKTSGRASDEICDLPDQLVIPPIADVLDNKTQNGHSQTGKPDNAARARSSTPLGDMLSSSDLVLQEPAIGKDNSKSSPKLPARLDLPGNGYADLLNDLAKAYGRRNECKVEPGSNNDQPTASSSEPSRHPVGTAEAGEVKRGRTGAAGFSAEQIAEFTAATVFPKDKPRSDADNFQTSPLKPALSEDQLIAKLAKGALAAGFTPSLQDNLSETPAVLDSKRPGSQGVPRSSEPKACDIPRLFTNGSIGSGHIGDTNGDTRSADPLKIGEAFAASVNGFMGRRLANIPPVPEPAPSLTEILDVERPKSPSGSINNLAQAGFAAGSGLFSNMVAGLEGDSAGSDKKSKSSTPSSADNPDKAKIVATAKAFADFTTQYVAGKPEETPGVSHGTNRPKPNEPSPITNMITRQGALIASGIDKLALLPENGRVANQSVNEPTAINLHPSQKARQTDPTEPVHTGLQMAQRQLQNPLPEVRLPGQGGLISSQFSRLAQSEIPVDAPILNKLTKAEAVSTSTHTKPGIDFPQVSTKGSTSIDNDASIGRTKTSVATDFVSVKAQVSHPATTKNSDLSIEAKSVKSPLLPTPLTIKILPELIQTTTRRETPKTVSIDLTTKSTTIGTIDSIKTLQSALTDRPSSTSASKLDARILDGVKLAPITSALANITNKLTGRVELTQQSSKGDANSTGNAAISNSTRSISFVAANLPTDFNSGKIDFAGKGREASIGSIGSAGSVGSVGQVGHVGLVGNTTIKVDTNLIGAKPDTIAVTGKDNGSSLVPVSNTKFVNVDITTGNKSDATIGNTASSIIISNGNPIYGPAAGIKGDTTGTRGDNGSIRIEGGKQAQPGDQGVGVRTPILTPQIITGIANAIKFGQPLPEGLTFQNGELSMKVGSEVLYFPGLRAALKFAQVFGLIERDGDQKLIEVETGESYKAEQIGTECRVRYIVNDGDTVASIARLQLGDARFDDLIVTINRSEILYRLVDCIKLPFVYTGQVIWLPSEQELAIYRKNMFTKTSEQLSAAGKQKPMTDESTDDLSKTARKAFQDEYTQITAQMPVSGPRTTVQDLPQLQPGNDELFKALARVRRAGNRPSVEIMIPAIDRTQFTKASIKQSETVVCNPKQQSTNYASQCETARLLDVRSLSRDARVIVSDFASTPDNFSVKLELLVNDDWMLVSSYEGSKTTAERVRHGINGARSTMTLHLPCRIVRSMAVEDYTRNWEQYKANFCANKTSSGTVDSKQQDSNQLNPISFNHIAIK